MSNTIVRLIASLALCLCACTLQLGPTDPAQTDPQPLQVPPEAWSAEYVPAVHGGMPGVVVEIDGSFVWPAPVDGAAVTYSAGLRGEGEEPQVGFGPIESDDRSIFIMVVPPVLAAQLDPEREPGQPREPREPVEPTPEVEAAEAAAVAARRAELIAAMDVARTSVALYDVWLVPELGGRSVNRQDAGPKKAKKTTYTWKVKVAKPGDPCDGKTPEACARQRLEDLRKRVCEAMKDGKKRFPRECSKLDALLKKKPPEPTVVCDIDKGKTAGKTEMLDGSITLNGDYLLQNEICGDATVLHELQHALDWDDGKKKNLKKLAEAEKRGKDAVGRLNAAAAGTAAHAKAKADKAKADADIKAVEADAGVEMVEDECNALFFTLNNGDFFGYPGKGDAWMAENVQQMVGELFGIGILFDALLHKKVKAALKKCTDKIKAWVDDPKNAPLKKKLAKKTVNTGFGVVPLLEMLERMANLYK